MSWGAIEYKYTAEEQAFLLLFNHGVAARTVQELIIKKLSDYGINSEYENKVLTYLKK